MAGFEWDKEPDGSLMYFPYVGHQTATMTDNIGLVRLRFVASQDQRDEDAHALQLALSRAQLRELGEGLLRLAELPHIPRPPTSAKN